MEKDIGSLKSLSGHTYDIVYNLLFTTERAIAMIIRHPLDVPDKSDIMTLFFGDRSAKRSERSERMKVAEDRLRLYEEQTYDELVSEHHFNFEIPYNKVARVELTRELFRARLIFHIPGGLNGKSKIIFTLSKKQFPEARRIVDLAFPSKS